VITRQGTLTGPVDGIPNPLRSRVLADRQEVQTVAEPAGHLIMVTGPSGVGKSTITEQLHQRLGGDWLLWQSDHCQPRHHPVSANLTPDQAMGFEERMFSANIGAIAAYLNNGWPVVAELAVMTAVEAATVRTAGQGRTMLVQLGCSPETLAAHVQERDTPVPVDWAVSFYEQWRNVDLPGAVRIDVNDITSSQVVDEILHRWSSQS